MYTWPKIHLKWAKVISFQIVSLSIVLQYLLSVMVSSFPSFHLYLSLIHFLNNSTYRFYSDVFDLNHTHVKDFSPITSFYCYHICIIVTPSLPQIFNISTFISLIHYAWLLPSWRGRWFPPGTPVSSTRKLMSSSFPRLDMTLAVAEALNPNKPSQT